MTENGKDRIEASAQFKKLSLKAFRNYADADLELGSGLTLVTGPNGHGKTNLVEAIYFLSLGRSFRERSDRRLIRFDAPACRLAGVVEWSGRLHELEIIWTRSGSKKARVDGSELQRISELVGKIPVVSLTPEDGELVQGEPRARRRFLDIVLAQTDVQYLEALKRYRRTRAQRNMSLRQGRFQLAETYEVTLADSAIKIRSCRRRFVEHIQRESKQTYRDISSGKERLSINYRPNPPLTENDRAAVLEALAEGREVDRERGFTGTGPHRDDLLLKIDERELKTYGSHGQARTALATLKLAEVAYYIKIYRRSPILIMDEVATVLDRNRVENLMKVLTEMSSQVFVTTPSASDLGELANVAERVIEVMDGTIKVRN